jgi:hypothetical protein
VVDLWLDCKRFGTQSFIAGPAGTIPLPPSPKLPCPGSVGEQPAALMDAFAMLAEWTKEG